MKAKTPKRCAAVFAVSAFLLLGCDNPAQQEEAPTDEVGQESAPPPTGNIAPAPTDGAAPDEGAVPTESVPGG